MPPPHDNLDRPLDDLISQSKQLRLEMRQQQQQPSQGQNGNFTARGRGGGPSRRRPMNRNATRTAPYHTHPRMNFPVPTKMDEIIEVPMGFTEGGVVDLQGSSTKLYISNLHYDVTEKDIELLFSDVGELERHAIHYDKSGRSKGTAEVVYAHHSDAVAAMERFNNQRLDGKQMEIMLVGPNFVTPAHVHPNINDLEANQSNVFHRLASATSRGSFHGRGGSGQVRRGGKKKLTTVEYQPRKYLTTEDLPLPPWKNTTTENLPLPPCKKLTTTESRSGDNIRTRSTFYGDTRVTFDELDADLEKYRLESKPVKRNQS